MTTKFSKIRHIVYLSSVKVIHEKPTSNIILNKSIENQEQDKKANSCQYYST
jgi:hypothetical protein